MRILGISAFYHDSAAALIVNDQVAGAAQEERFSRNKHDASFPENAIRYCLESANLRLSEIDRVVFYDKPFLKFDRLFETYRAFAPHGAASFRRAALYWIKEKLFQKVLLQKALKVIDSDYDGRLDFTEHHQAHAASAFFPSPFEEAVVLTLDGVGEWATTSMGIGRTNELKLLKEIRFPHSLGLLYSAITFYLGFRVNSGEYKVMGLAPYGEPRHTRLLCDELIDIKPDGSFHLNMDYFDFCTGLKMTNKRLHDLLGGPPREPNSKLETKHMDLAASLQEVVNQIIVRLAKSLIDETGITNICLAGGVALNCVANGKLLDEPRIKGVWVQPAAGDAGGALGAALCLNHWVLRRPRQHNLETPDLMQGALLGPEFKQGEIERRLNDVKARFDVFGEDELIDRCVAALCNDAVVGWFQGRMEFGPRALGSRSILANPRSSNMQRRLNLKTKFRESFRPFAPAVLREYVSEWFELDDDSPYMMFVRKLSEDKRIVNEDNNFETAFDKLKISRSQVPAITHVDYSARIQTVHREINPLFHKLISRFHEFTGIPMLVNTSFNVRGEPIVCGPQDAFSCFMHTGIDFLVIGNCFLDKRRQLRPLAENRVLQE